MLRHLLTALACWAAGAAPGAPGLPSCTFAGCSTCLLGAKRQRENLTIVGASGAATESPLRIARAPEYWDTQAVMAQLVGIVAAERLGFEVEYVACIDEVSCTFAATNCLGWRDYACGQAYSAEAAAEAAARGLKLHADELADVMLLTESYKEHLSVDAFAGTDLPYESRQVVVAGNTGFLSRDGLYTYADLVDHSDGLLAWFPALALPSVRAPLSPPRRLIEDGVAAEELGCSSDIDYVNASMVKHLELGWTCVDSWWLNPACAALGEAWNSSCVVILEDDWGYVKKWLYEAGAKTNTPVAKLMVGFDPWWELVYYHAYDVIFTWWKPDAGMLPARPQRMLLADVDDNDPWPALKVAWGPALEADARLRHLLTSASVGQRAMEDLMQKVAQAYEDGHAAGAEADSFYQKLACDWLRENEAEWSTWLMSERSCDQGEAFDAAAERCLPCPAGSHGVKFLNSTAVCVPCLAGSSASEPGSKDCAPCPPGSFQNVSGSSFCIHCSRGESQPASGQRRCELCAPGRVASDEGSSSCWQCGRGSYADAEGASECQFCPRGSFVDLQGASGCERCGRGLTTLDMASRSAGDCCCQEGTFLPEGGSQCLPCGECMECPTGSKEANIPRGPLDTRNLGPYPGVLPGCMSKLAAPLRPYRCQVAAWCPGGPAASCSFNRDPGSIGCGACPPGHFSDSEGRCARCGSAALAAVLGFGAASLLALGAVAVIVDSKAAKTSRNSITCTVVSALTLQSAQTLGVFGSLAIEWPEPGRSVMALVSALAFNLEVLQAECFVGQSKVAGFAARQLLGPLAASYVALVVFCRRRFVTKEGQYAEAVVNGTGSVYQMLFVSIFVSVALPFVCFEHPGGNGTSMRTFPEVLCFASEQHAAMVALSAASLAAGIVPFVCVVIYATLFYRRILASSQGRAHKHLMMFRFLFFRFKPERYYFGAVLLLRNCLVCLVPTATWRYPATQVLLIAIVFMVFQGVQLNLQPWRGTLDNVVDGGVASAMVLLLLCASMSSDFANTTRTVGALIATVIGLVFAVLLALAARALYRVLAPPLAWSALICHHKADAAAQARYLQLRLVKSTGSRVFLDSDHLQHLDDLLDVVRCNIGRLIVYHTARTMRRPWCAAEITTAFLASRRCVGVLTPSFRLPTSDEILPDEVLATFVEASDVDLVERGLAAATVSAALAWHLSPSCPKVALEPPAAGGARFDRLVDALTLDPTRSMVLGRLVANDDDVGCTFRRGMLLISMDPEDGEACATAGILDMLLNEKVLSLVPEGIYVPCSSLESIPEDFVEECTAVLVILSRGTLQSTAQRKLLLQLGSSPHVEAIPILTPDHRIPDAAWFDGASDPLLAEAVRAFFKRIAIALTTPGSLPVIEAQCDAVAARLRPASPAWPSRSGQDPTVSLSASQRLFTKPRRDRSALPPAPPLAPAPPAPSASSVLAPLERDGEAAQPPDSQAESSLRQLLRYPSERPPASEEPQPAASDQ